MGKAQSGVLGRILFLFFVNFDIMVVKVNRTDMNNRFFLSPTKERGS